MEQGKHEKYQRGGIVSWGKLILHCILKAVVCSPHKAGAASFLTLRSHY